MPPIPLLTRHLLLLALLCLCAEAASAQIAGNLRGEVLDPANLGLGGARITVTEESTGAARTSTTISATGEFLEADLLPGRYQIEVTAPGFNRLLRRDVTVSTGLTTSLNLHLTPGAPDQTVTVSADAPLLQAADSDIQTSIPRPDVLGLPLNGRNFIQLATLAPGVSLPPGTLLPRINGGRPRTNEYLFDGISALQPEPGQVAFFPILDDIEEFTVESNNVGAEFGRFNGGVVNLSTRSGTNTLHGSLYDFFRNEALNARNYFATPTSRKPEYRRNQFGATLGAPILHNRLFFFGGYQGQQQAIAIPRISTVPTLAQRQGIFTGTAHIFDPTTTVFSNGAYTRHEFANDVITRTFDPAAANLLARIPLPTSTATANNYTRTADDLDHQNQFDARVDANLRRSGRIFARYSYFHDVEQPVSPFPEGSGAITGSVTGTGNVAGLSHVLGQQAVLGETHTFGARMLNDARLGYTRRSNNIQGATLPGPASAALGIPGIPTNAAFSDALPLFTITGEQQLGSSASVFSQYQTGVWEVVDSFQITTGRHALKFGGDLRSYQLNAIAPPNPTGLFSFTTTGTNQQGLALPSTDKRTNGNALASFLLGQVDTFSIDFQSSVLRPRDNIQEIFAQDDWRLTPQLTLNLGARYTLNHPSTEKNNQGAIFNLSTQQLQYLGVDGFPRSARELHYGNLAPRLGFTYLLTPRTVVRSGFGIVFIDQSGITTPFTTPQFPFIQNVRQATQDSINAALTLSSGPTVQPIPLTPDAGLGQSVYTANRNLGSGYVEQWNLAVQRELKQNLSFDIAYVGSHIVHVGIPDANLNQLPVSSLPAESTPAGLAALKALQAKVANPFFGQIPASSAIGGRTVAAAQLLKPFPRFQNVAYYRNNTGTTNFNAIEAKVEQRLSGGLSFLFSYTHSKLIDDASSVFSSTVFSSPSSNSLIAADVNRPYLERDSSNGDVPNVTSLSALYQVPAGRGHRFASSGIASVLAGGWNVNGISSLQSGMPVTVTMATNDYSFAGIVTRRPDLIARPSLSPSARTPQVFFNTAAFAAPIGVLGTASRNPVRGPAYRDLDLAAIKHTPISERTDLEFRAELFNVSNTPAFAQPNGSFGTTAFGSITSTTTDPRVVQFALRLSR